MALNYSAVLYAGAERELDSHSIYRLKLGGKFVLSHSLDPFDGDDACTEVLLVACDAVAQWIKGDPLTFVSAKLKVLPATGGRLADLRGAVEQAGEEALVVHDAAWPNFGGDLVGRLLGALKPDCGVVPAVPLPGALARLTALPATDSAADESNIFGAKADHRIGELGEFADGDGRYIVQSPQAYYRDGLLAALKAAGDGDGDPSVPYGAAGNRIAAVAGRLGNLALEGDVELRQLTKLMGGTQRKKRDKHSGLGW